MNYLLKIRYAAKADREEVLKFCINTFEWGDYIDQVWDLWYSDHDGSLLVVEDDDQVCGTHKDERPSVIALGHASLCPNKKSVWLEGIRVNPNYRRRSIATGLLNEMMSYGKQKGATQASAIVAANNIASNSMMERNGFAVISKWNYFSTDKVLKRANNVGLTSRVASGNDAEMITNFLRQSHIYKASGGAYVNSWRWYFLDLYSNTLTDLINTDRILINGNGQIEGLAIINRPVNNCIIDNKNDKNRNRNTNSLQVVYIDTTSSLVLKDLLSFAMNLTHSDGVICDRIQVYIPQASFISAAMDQVGLEVSEQFLLYKKEI